MKNYELLDMIGEVNEDYVLAAGDSAARPRFRWKTLAACAACAALIVAAYPAWQASRSEKRAAADSAPTLDEAPEAAPGETLAQRPGLHAYTLVEGGGQIITTGGEEKAPAGGMEGPIPEPALPPRENGPDLPDGAYVAGDAPVDALDQGAPSQEEAIAQYDRLFQGMGLSGEGKLRAYPDWFAGAWIDGEKLTIAIVNGHRTPELEQRIREWTEGDIVFQDAKYSQNYLDSLMDGITRVLDELDCRLSSSYGVYVMDNYLGLDFFGGVPGDDVLAALAGLDPEGDAIRIQVFADGRIALTDEAVKGPAPVEPVTEPVPGGAQAEPDLEAEPTPAPVEDSEWTVPEELPQAKSDVISGEEQ